MIGEGRQPTFFLKRSDRLIARIQTIVYGWRFARHAGCRTVALWPPANDHAKQYDEPDFSPTQIFDLQAFYSSGGGDSLIFLEGRFGNPKKPRTVFSAEFETARKNGFSVEALSGDDFYESVVIPFRHRDEPSDRGYLARSLRETYERLPLHPAIRDGVEKGRQRLGDAAIALHVRRGDIPDLLRLRAKELEAGTVAPSHLTSAIRGYLIRMAPFEAYYPAIERAISSGKKVTVFSDSADALPHFIKTFGARHIAAPPSVPRGRVPIQRDFVDFNLLAGASEIIGTGGSSYSVFASMIGCARYVNVTGTMPLDRLERGLKNVWLAGMELSDSSMKRLSTELAEQYEKMQRDYPPSDGEPPLPVQDMRRDQLIEESRGAAPIGPGPLSA